MSKILLKVWIYSILSSWVTCDTQKGQKTHSSNEEKEVQDYVSMVANKTSGSE